MGLYGYNFMIITSSFLNPIVQEIRECMSVESGPLIVTDKMPCGMLRFRSCDVSMARVSTEGKTGNKMTVYMSSWNGHLVIL